MEDDPYSIIVTAVLLSAFFSGIEIAFVSANKLKIELGKQKGEISGIIYGKFLNNPARFITTMLLGNNISLVIYGLAMAALLEPFISPYFSNSSLVLLIQTIISTIVILIFSEFLPKVIFGQYPNRMLKVFLLPASFFYFISYPFVSFITWISDLFLLNILKIENPNSEKKYDLADLNNYLDEISSTDEGGPEELENEIQILQNVLEFSQVKARECMVPRNEITSISVDDSINKLSKKFISSGHTKIIVYRDTIDNIIGYVHASEMFRNPESIKNILLPVSMVPETMTAEEVLKIFIQKKRSMAVVLDEYGGTSGIITLEDIVEEIFGEIVDEHDKDNTVEEKLDDQRYLFSARLEVDYLNEMYGLRLPKSETYETIAGYVIDQHESIPEQGEIIKTDDYLIEIKKVSGNRIELLEIQPHIPE
jgi:putative hemolysin